MDRLPAKVRCTSAIICLQQSSAQLLDLLGSFIHHPPQLFNAEAGLALILSAYGPA
jgi:hypothetical protein